MVTIDNPRYCLFSVASDGRGRSGVKIEGSDRLEPDYGSPKNPELKREFVEFGFYRARKERDRDFYRPSGVWMARF